MNRWAVSAPAPGHLQQAPPPARRRTRRPRSRRPVAVLVAALVLVPVAPWAVTDAEAFGAVPTPKAPVQVFLEDFETLDPEVPAQTPRSIADYTGAAPLRPTYQADPAWLTHCNGTVTGAPQENGYTSYRAANDCVPLAYYNAQQLDLALVSAGSVPDEGGNDSLTARTDQPGEGFDPGAGKVQVETARQLPIALTNRFLGVGLLTAAMNCGRSGFVPALLELGLKTGSTGQEVHPLGEVVDVCDSAREVTVGPSYQGGYPTSNPVRAVLGDWRTSESVLYTGSSLGLRVVNQQASGTGNDVALDDLRILDVTPRLSQAFGAGQIALWGSTTMTFTVTNTDELGAKRGFSFREQLPAGLQVSPVAGYTTSCGNATSTGARPQSTLLSFKGTLPAGTASCSYSVRVSATSRGTKTNATGSNVVGLVGLDAPAVATLVVA